MSEAPSKALDVSAQHPLDDATQEVLYSQGAEQRTVERYTQDFRQFTAERLGELGLAIAMSSETAQNPVVGVHEHGASQSIAETTYEKLRGSPRRKLEHDSELALSFLRGLGPTNPLRQEDGYDAAFELSRVKHLLESDYNALPDGTDQATGGENQRKPEYRMAEGLIAEELALLWTPQALRSATKDSGMNQTIANSDDPNLFTEEQIKNLKPSERWVLVGAKLCDEATEIYDAIYKSRTADKLTRVEAFTRGVDMKLRALQLRMAVAKDPTQFAEYDKGYRLLTRQHAQVMSDQWAGLLTKLDAVRPTENQEEQLGLLFESNAVAIERLKLIEKGAHRKTSVRLAMPREDSIEKSIMPLLTRGGKKLNLSSDVIFESIAGKKLKTLQVKSMRGSSYESRLQKSNVKHPVIYPEATTEMRFLDSPGYERLDLHAIENLPVAELGGPR